MVCPHLAVVVEGGVIPEGWEIKTAMFDFGTKWGVAVQSIEPIDGKVRRHAVRSLAINEREAVVDAAPQLAAWIAEKGWQRH